MRKPYRTILKRSTLLLMSLLVVSSCGGSGAAALHQSLLYKIQHRLFQEALQRSGLGKR